MKIALVNSKEVSLIHLLVQKFSDSIYNFPVSSANRVWKFEKCDEKNGDECAQRLYLFGYRQLHEKNTARNDREMREYCG